MRFLWGTQTGQSYEGPSIACAASFSVRCWPIPACSGQGSSSRSATSFTGLIGGALVPDLTSLGHADSAVAGLLLMLAYAVMAVLLVIQVLVRLALLDLLLILSPLGLLCAASPRTQSWARLWSKLFVQTLAQQFLQIVTLHFSMGLLIQLAPVGEPDANVVTTLAGRGRVVSHPQGAAPAERGSTHGHGTQRGRRGQQCRAIGRPPGGRAATLPGRARHGGAGPAHGSIHHARDAAGERISCVRRAMSGRLHGPPRTRPRSRHGHGPWPTRPPTLIRERSG